MTIGQRPLVVLDALLVNQRPTGVGRSILELLPALASQDRGFDFLVLATEPDMFSELGKTPGWEVLDCPGARGGTLRKAWFTQRTIPRICRERGAFLLHSLQFVAPLSLPCASVVTVHDLAWLRFPHTVEEPRRSYYRFFVPRTLSRADAVVTNSQATARDTEYYYPATAPKISATPFGTPSWVWKQERMPARRSESPFFLFVGTLEPRKNLEGLLEAFAEFHRRQKAGGAQAEKTPRLVLIGGKGWKDNRLRKLMQPLVEAGILEVQDYCGTDELWRLYGSALALLFPSLHEGFGFPILEALAAGLPVMTSDRGAMAEIGGSEVLAVDPENRESLIEGMLSLTEDLPYRKDCLVRGPNYAKQWSWVRTADLTTGVYRDLLDRSPGK